MELYFAPMACSLASRIALYESDQSASFHQVVLGTKMLSTGENYLDINPKGQVPALRLDDGTILTEGPAVLQYVADLAPDSGLAPRHGSYARYELQSWLNYISSEVHKQIFYVIFNPSAPAEAKNFVRDTIAPAKFEHLAAHLSENAYLLGNTFTVADAYLLVMLNLTQYAGLDLVRWPILAAYRERLMARPAVAKAVSEEAALAG